jgi:hypothetical protein
VDLGMTAAFLVVSIAVLFQARAWPFRTSLFPLAAGSVLCGMALLKLALALAPARRLRAFEPRGLVEGDEVEEAEPIDIFATASHAQWVSALGWMGAFFAMLWLLGALVTVPLFALIYLISSRESPVLAGTYALASWLFVYGLFDRVLHTPLPVGALLTALGNLS